MTGGESERGVRLMNQPHLVSKNALPLAFIMWCLIKHRENLVWCSWKWCCCMRRTAGLQSASALSDVTDFVAVVVCRSYAVAPIVGIWFSIPPSFNLCTHGGKKWIPRQITHFMGPATLRNPKLAFLASRLPLRLAFVVIMGGLFWSRIWTFELQGLKYKHSGAVEITEVLVCNVVSSGRVVVNVSKNRNTITFRVKT